MDNRSVLIADDETHILNVLTIKLTNAGYHVLTAQDGEEAHRLACTHLPELIITDYQMPLLSGLELCSRLRNSPDTKDIPAILLTARGFSMSQREKTQDNIREIVTKPFSPREILALAERLIARVPAATSTG